MPARCSIHHVGPAAFPATLCYLALAACHGRPALVDRLRDLSTGDTFTAPQLMPAGWMRDAAWRVQQAAHVESAHAMTAGGSTCAAHGFVLTTDEQAVVVDIVALECGGVLVPAPNGELAITSPMMASAQDAPTLQLRFVAAVRPDVDVLWVSARAVQAGELVALEHVYAVAPAGRIEPILATVGADPAAGRTAPGGYVARFTGDRTPLVFECGDATAMQRWRYRDGAYVFERP
jgi:hypothetical protein